MSAWVDGFVLCRFLQDWSRAKPPTSFGRLAAGAAWRCNPPTQRGSISPRPASVSDHRDLHTSPLSALPSAAQPPVHDDVDKKTFCLWLFPDHVVWGYGSFCLHLTVSQPPWVMIWVVFVYSWPTASRPPSCMMVWVVLSALDRLCLGHHAWWCRLFLSTVDRLCLGHHAWWYGLFCLQLTDCVSATMHDGVGCFVYSWPTVSRPPCMMVWVVLSKVD